MFWPPIPLLRADGFGALRHNHMGACRLSHEINGKRRRAGLVAKIWRIRASQSADIETNSAAVGYGEWACRQSDIQSKRKQLWFSFEVDTRQAHHTAAIARSDGTPVAQPTLMAHIWTYSHVPTRC
jgi:hypothetical protein